MNSPFDDPKVKAVYERWQQANRIAFDAAYFDSTNAEELWILEETALDQYTAIYDAWIAEHKHG